MNFKKIKSIAIIAFVSVFLTNCSSETNDDFTPDPNDVYAGELSVFDIGEDNRAISINGSDVAESNALVKVTFRDADNSMKRLYITKNTSGLGDEPFVFSAAGVTVDDKKDGSLDLSGDNASEFEFAIPFPVPTEGESKIVYTLWATTGRGDFRDITKRNAIVVDGVSAVGTVTITGSVTFNPTGLSTYTAKLLAAPLGDGSSETFMSTFDGQVYTISQGAEFADIWDFGYYYGTTGAFPNNATLLSASDYPTGVLDIPNLTGVAPGDLNNCYFRKSSMTTAEFDAVVSADELTFTRPDSERVVRLAVDDVVEFEDQYGKKGLIKVIDINPGVGSLDYIQFDVKVQN